MKKEYDVTIVGEEPAGSTTAKYLTKKVFNEPLEKRY
jgi:flavin-dependent dehydrogenase